MKWINRLFKKKIPGQEIVYFFNGLGDDEKLYQTVYSKELLGKKAGYNLDSYWYINAKRQGDELLLELEMTPVYVRNRRTPEKDNPKYITDKEHRKTIYEKIPIKEASKIPLLKKYIKGKSLEKSLAVLSVASVLASAFFISNNITGNAILTNNANSSGLIGAGLFVFGLVCFFVVKNIE